MSRGLWLRFIEMVAVFEHVFVSEFLDGICEVVLKLKKKMEKRYHIQRDTVTRRICLLHTTLLKSNSAFPSCIPRVCQEMFQVPRQASPRPSSPPPQPRHSDRGVLSWLLESHYLEPVVDMA